MLKKSQSRFRSMPIQRGGQVTDPEELARAQEAANRYGETAPGRAEIAGAIR